MNIGFDGKRYFHNSTGLGNYSRTLVDGLTSLFPENQYYLFNPKASTKYQKASFSNLHEVQPEQVHSKLLNSLWRSSWVKKDFEHYGIQLYHGLSHEIPVGIRKTGIPTVVTIHDLIFERYPEQFKKVDVQIYRKKFRYACNNANRIIAISQQTKKDIVELYNIAADKIDVCYQSCNPAFGSIMSEEEKRQVRKMYNLPDQFFLYVGSIIERKNLLSICKAIKMLRGRVDIPLIVIGNGKKYKEEVKGYIEAEGLKDRVIFMSEKQETNNASFQKPETFAAIYQMAEVMIYPSIYEGFGIPVLEALWSRLPVITSDRSCLPETGGDGAVYVDPFDINAMADSMHRLINDNAYREEHIERGWRHAQKFTLGSCCNSVMDVYKNLVNERAV